MLGRLTALLLLVPGPALAQLVRGSVVDAATGAQIAGVEIRVLDRSGRVLLSAASDARGNFEVPLHWGDGVHLQFLHLGYHPAQSEPLAAGSGEVLELPMRLTPAAVPLKELTVVAPRRTNQALAEFYQRAAANRRVGQGRIWTREDLDADPRTSISKRLATVPSRPGCKRREVYFDGAPLSTTPVTGLASGYHPPLTKRQIELAQMSVDLEPAPAPPPGADLVDWLAPTEEVEGVEVYRDNEIPVQFNPDGELCQVTLIWRKAPPNAVPVDYAGARRALLVVGGGALLGLLLTLLP